MTIKRNETLGAIVQAIINLREHIYMTPEMMTASLAEYGVSWKMLQENRNFVEGVWSGFTWPQGQEATFWRMILSFKDTEVVSVQEQESNPSEPVSPEVVPQDGVISFSA